MWIVELALRRPHTFIVMAIAIAMFGILSIINMPIDIFPRVNVPIVSCVWTYTGMSPTDMELLISTVTERALTSTVNGIEHMESMSVNGMSIIKVYLHQNTPVGEAVAMVSSVGNAVRKQLPRGISPPFVTASSATDVPVLQLILRSDTLTEAKLFDIANNILRSQLATIQGATVPFPYGGKYRQVMVDLDQSALSALQLSSADVVTAVNNQNVIDPMGTAKMGSTEYVITLNSMAAKIDDLNHIPIKMIKGTVVFLGDVAQVHDGAQPQLNVVNLNGQHAVLFNVLKSGNASTLSVVAGAKKLLPKLRAIVPKGCEIDILTDQSIFVKNCVEEVASEAATAAGLTALMILALLGSWRSTLIVATSIPLAILAAMIGLDITGNTINSMTLGGLALAVGMLVDDATVAIENLHRHLAMGEEMETAILTSSNEVALPALVSTLAICIVFVPVVFLIEPSKSLFVPLGLSVILAMIASYGLSRTVVPLMCKYLLAHEGHGGTSIPPYSVRGFFIRVHNAIERTFESMREKYANLLAVALANPRGTVILFLSFYAVSFCLLPFIGREYFPTIDGGALRLHVVGPTGTRIELTDRLFRRVEKTIRDGLPPGIVTSIVDNIGLPVSGINYAYSDSQTISEADGEIIITLNEHRPHNTEFYQEQVRQLVKQHFPDCTFYFQPADIVTQILNAGLPAPIAIRVFGMDRKGNFELTEGIRREARLIPGAVDVVIHQMVNGPHFIWDLDRVRSAQIGISQNDTSVSNNISLSSSFQTQPNFYFDKDSRITYNLATQTPQYDMSTVQDTGVLPITGIGSNESNKPSVLMFNLGTVSRTPTPEVCNHLNVQPLYECYVSTYGRDLGGVVDEVHKIAEKYKKQLKRGNFLMVGGQALAMTAAFAELLGGLAFSILLVYLLLVVNFQSWTDPLIILMAVPGAFSGIMWSLFVTQTAFSIPALMGTIMTVGVASANSILMVTFARQQLAEGKDALTAAQEAGSERFRPVIMTATAMIIGMIPMAIGAGESSQNAPIGRAVIGGLIVATFSTLFFVPLFFMILRRRQAAQPQQQKG
ncbi:MAG TPA: efflux RND transporter permease subunit [Planktothrix sp.]|jgi:multidrug efflux pump subunit AcrB